MARFKCVSKKPRLKWGKSKPRGESERQTMKDKCGSSCYIRPKELKFPICEKRTCCVRCDALKAAYTRTAQLWRKYPPRQLRKIGKIALKSGCDWAKKERIKASVNRMKQRRSEKK